MPFLFETFAGSADGDLVIFEWLGDAGVAVVAGGRQYLLSTVLPYGCVYGWGPCTCTMTGYLEEFIGVVQ